MQWYEPSLCCVENAIVQKPWRILLPLLCGELTGAFHSTQNSGNFDWYINHFDLIRPEYSGPALKVVHFDWSGYLGRSDRNVPFHLTKLLSPVPLFCILLTRTIKRAVDWVGSVQPECTVPLGTWNFRNFRWEFFLNGKHAIFRISRFGRFSDKPLLAWLFSEHAYQLYSKIYLFMHSTHYSLPYRF